jgi:flagellin-like protein
MAKKGISSLIAEILLVMIVLVLMSSFYLFYKSSAESAFKSAESEEEAVDCSRYSSFVIESIDGNEVTIRNNGARELDTRRFYAYINNEPISRGASSPDIIAANERATLILGVSPSSGDRLKIVGDCKAGDEYYIR